MKIVLNGCYGGFSLSYEAMYLYWQAKNKEAYFYADMSTYEGAKKIKFKRVTLSEIPKLKHVFYVYCTTDDQGEILDHYPENIWRDRDVDRTDPTLVSVVEIIGSKAASGRFASLEIHEIPSGTQYRIDEYDGIEELITKEDDDWKTAGIQYQSIQTQGRIQAAWDLIKPAPTPDPDLTFKY